MKLSEDQRVKPTAEISNIMLMVAEKYSKVAEKNKGYKVSDKNLRGRSRKQYIAEARMALMLLIKNKGYTLAQVGSMLGRRDHATVNWGLKTITSLKGNNQLLVDDKEFIDSLVLSH